MAWASAISAAPVSPPASWWQPAELQ